MIVVLYGEQAHLWFISQIILNYATSYCIAKLIKKD